MVFYAKKGEASYSSTKMNPKSIREKERRDEINNKINELRSLVCTDENDKKTLKQSDVLDRTVELVYQMENESPGPSFVPERKGFVDGFSFVETETFSFIKQLGVAPQVCNDFLEKTKKCFNEERRNLLISSSTPSTLQTPYRSSSKLGPTRLRNSPSESVRSTPSPYSNCIDRKEIKKNREQDRRDRQGEAIEALKSFLISISANKKTMKLQVEKMQRLNTLENIIEYIQNKKNRFVTNNQHDLILYNHAFNGGYEIAKRTAIEFFKKDRHFCVQTAALEQYLDISRSSKCCYQPIQQKMFPIMPIFQPMINMFPLITSSTRIPSPTYSLESPPPPSDTSLSSIESTPSNRSIQNNSNVWRPWE